MKNVFSDAILPIFKIQRPTYEFIKSPSLNDSLSIFCFIVTYSLDYSIWRLLNRIFVYCKSKRPLQFKETFPRPFKSENDVTRLEIVRFRNCKIGARPQNVWSHSEVPCHSLLIVSSGFVKISSLRLPIYTNTAIFCFNMGFKDASLLFSACKTLIIGI